MLPERSGVARAAGAGQKENSPAVYRRGVAGGEAVIAVLVVLIETLFAKARPFQVHLAVVFLDELLNTAQLAVA